MVESVQSVSVFELVSVLELRVGVIEVSVVEHDVQQL